MSSAAQGPVITALADDGEFNGWDQDTGNPTEMNFASAVQVWSIAQGRPTTLTEAAMAFNVQPGLISQAVEAHPWMFMSGDVIDHDGE